MRILRIWPTSLWTPSVFQMSRMAQNVYIFSGVVCYLLYYEYSYISSKRIAHYYSSKPQPHQFTILVRGIPVSSGSSCSETVEKFFTEYYPSTYLSHSVVRRTNKLQRLTSDAKKLYRRLVHLKSETNPQRRSIRDGFCGLFGHKVNVLDHYGKKLETLEDNVRMEQLSVAGKEVPAAFVSFKSRLGAAVALHIQQGTNPTEWVTERAPEPQDIHWPFFSSSFIKRWISKLLVVVAYAAVTILFLIPVVIVQGLTNLEQLETYFPFLESILSLTVVSEVITGYLPSLILQMFIAFVPPIMIMLSSVEGCISFSQIEKSACIKMLCFTIWNIFFANALSGTVLYRFDIFLDPKEIPGILADAVPAQLLIVYAPKYDTGGRFWPTVHNSTIFSLVLMHIIAIGIFGLKNLSLASSLIVPLPILTLLFNEYCRKRFLPIFEDYPLECLIKKDRQDQNDPTIAVFYNKLSTAYEDPALMPIRHPRSTDDHNSPLLQAGV
ncbi:hypothetical protein PRUPE_3G263100 [Prunus persica]|uniref:CSC1-like protein HYP1 n=1 Tax=Prunus persica TaxID=3760 RepID=A0A251Q5T4_PRUPE|nr:hypothetical protein PRUPE_3G263100 [Prunus persica]